MVIKQTKGNKANPMKGSRLRIFGGGRLVDEFQVPSRKPLAYCEKYEGGYYGRRYRAAVEAAREADAALGGAV